MKFKIMPLIYILMMGLAIIIPFYNLYPYLIENGFPIVQVVNEIFNASSLVSFFMADLFIASIVFIIFVFSDARKYNIKYFYIPIIFTFLIGFSFAFPMYLLIRYNQMKMLL
jgi:hypothetical protein